jgi:hypothetical protein
LFAAAHVQTAQTELAPYTRGLPAGIPDGYEEKCKVSYCSCGEEAARHRALVGHVELGFVCGASGEKQVGEFADPSEQGVERCRRIARVAFCSGGMYLRINSSRYTLLLHKYAVRCDLLSSSFRQYAAPLSALTVFRYRRPDFPISFFQTEYMYPALKSHFFLLL